MDKFTENVKTKGAILLAVHRGKIAEGMQGLSVFCDDKLSRSNQ